MEVHQWDNTTYMLASYAGYPRSLADEFQATVPPYVSAAAYDGTSTVYLLHGYIMFVYHVITNTVPGMTYTYGGQFDVRGTGGFIQKALCAITAMYLYDQTVLVFCGFTLYNYEVGTGVWIKHGDVKTPCDP